jgi:hypothetical protein
VSTKLLGVLQRAMDDPVWDDNCDLLLWLIYIGGAFSPTGVVRFEYGILLRQSYLHRFIGVRHTWPNLVRILKQYIWSEKAYEPQVRAFWEEHSI